VGDPGPEVRKSGKRRRCRGLLTGGVGAIGDAHLKNTQTTLPISHIDIVAADKDASGIARSIHGADDGGVCGIAYVYNLQAVPIVSHVGVVAADVNAPGFARRGE
jgi:hypothetical protein